MLFEVDGWRLAGCPDGYDSIYAALNLELHVLDEGIVIDGSVIIKRRDDRRVYAFKHCFFLAYRSSVVASALSTLREYRTLIAIQ